MLISDFRLFKPQLLTAIFRATDILSERESVEKITLNRQQESHTSTLYYVSVQYTDYRSQRHAPDHLTVKLTKHDFEYGEREVRFYDDVMRPILAKYKPAELCLPTIYDAYYEPINGGSHIIMEDLSKDFRERPEPQPPTPRHREMLMRALGRIHAYWWEHPDLGKLGTLPTVEQLDGFQATYAEKFAELEAFSGKHLPKSELDVLRQVSQAMPPRRRERLLAGQGLTVVHRDLHPQNILHSHSASRIIDWQAWRVDTATDDLAYMIACHYPQSILKFEERKLLQTYYNELLKGGVTGYTYDDLLYDYRASVARCVGFLLAAWTKEGMMGGKWHRLEAAINAYKTLRVAEIYT